VRIILDFVHDLATFPLFSGTLYIEADSNHKGERQVTTNIQTQGRSTDNLAMRRDISEFIFDLALELTAHDRRFASKLRQVLAAHRTELQRRDSGDAGSPEYFASVDVYRLMTARLILQHIDHLTLKRAQHTPWTKEDRRTTRFLNAALDDFADGQRDLLRRFDPPETDNLAKAIWFNFYDITRSEAEQDAAAIRSYFADAANTVAARKNV
jgi:hypothetical protein